MQALKARPWLVGSLLLVGALLAAAIVWWLVPDSSTLSAQEVMEDACADASTLTSYDAVISAEDVPWRIEAEISQSQDGAISIVSRTYDSSDSARSLSASSGVTLESERVYIFDAPPRPTPANSREAATTPQAVDVGVTAYGRRMENGEWTAWEVGRTSRGTMESDPGNIFCGEILSQFATFRYNGQEQINGIQTRKYTGTIEMPEPVWGELPV